MGMRCKKHPFQAGGGGVCATCLRGRLLVLAAAQNGDSSPLPPPAAAPEPAAAALPRSVSPYVSRRKSDAAALRNHHPSLLFFRTPQVGPAGSGALEEGDIGYEYEKRRAGRFSVLATLFGHHHHHHRRSGDGGGAKERKKKHSYSWFAGIIPRRRKKQTPEPSVFPPGTRRSCRVVSNRGLSPERNSNGSEGEEESSSSPAVEPPWRPSPSLMPKTPGRRRQTNSMPSGFAVCLSPLVRPSPAGRRHRGVQPPDPCSFSCELRPSPLHNLSSAASITRCRSRKLADGGRFR